MPRTKEQFEEIREERQKQILDAAMKLFANKGYHVTSISQISKAANISKGLMYNYFDSKKDLLIVIFVDLMNEIMKRVDPNQDDVIDEQEAEAFIDTLFDVVIENPGDWKLFYQLMMQQEVMEIMMKENLMEKFLHAQQMLFNYFANRQFDDPVIAIMHFSSLYKGFALQYSLAPELFNKDEINRFKTMIKGFFVQPLRTDSEERIELTESIGYMLL